MLQGALPASPGGSVACQRGLIKQKAAQLGLDGGGDGLFNRYTKLIARERFVTRVNLCSRHSVAAVWPYFNGGQRRIDAQGVYSGPKVTGVKLC